MHPTPRSDPTGGVSGTGKACPLLQQLRKLWAKTSEEVNGNTGDADTADCWIRSIFAALGTRGGSARVLCVAVSPGRTHSDIEQTVLTEGVAPCLNVNTGLAALGSRQKWNNLLNETSVPCSASSIM